MDLVVFIKKSNSDIADISKTIESLNHKDINLISIVPIDNISDINYRIINSKWWMVLYDDEYVDSRLIKAIPIIEKQDVFDVFSCYRLGKELKISFCPRFFCNWIELEGNNLYPKNHTKIEFLLDGWIYEHGVWYNDNNESQS